MLLLLLALINAPAHALLRGWSTQDARFANVGVVMTVIPDADSIMVTTCVGTRLSKHAVLTAAHCTVPFLKTPGAHTYFLTDSFLKRWASATKPFSAEGLLGLFAFKGVTDPMEAFRLGVEFAEVKAVALNPWLPKNFAEVYTEEVFDPPEDFSPAAFFHKKQPGEDWQKHFNTWRTSIFDLAILQIETPTDKVLSEHSSDPAWQPVRDALGNSFRATRFEIPSLSYRKAGRFVNLVAYRHQKSGVPSEKTFSLFQFNKNLTAVPDSMEKMGFFGLESVPEFYLQMTEEGDSGAPVFQAINGRYYLIGVLSGMSADGYSNFVSTAPHAEWIRKQVNGFERNAAKKNAPNSTDAKTR